jgi:hypothetical protein
VFGYKTEEKKRKKNKREREKAIVDGRNKTRKSE